MLAVVEVRLLTCDAVLEGVNEVSKVGELVAELAPPVPPELLALADEFGFERHGVERTQAGVRPRERHRPPQQPSECPEERPQAIARRHDRRIENSPE